MRCSLRQHLHLLVSLGIASGVLIVSGQERSEESPQDSIQVEEQPGAERKLKEQDEVRLTVFGEDSLGMVAKIDSSGSINFPLVGNVTVIGKTATDVAAIIEERLEADYIRDAHVTVSVVEEYKEEEKPKVIQARPAPSPAPRTTTIAEPEPLGEVTILGEIRRPGTVKFEGDGIDLLTVLAQAGGFTPLANPKKVIVRRSAEGGNTEVYTVNAKDLQEGGTPFFLLPGDSVSVAKRLF